MPLTPCPTSPNCVSSQSSDLNHLVEPIPYSGALEGAKAQILHVLTSLPRTTIVKNEAHYVHAECRSLIFRFTDDVEFLFDDEHKVIHVRSASRVGYSDLGVNRQRVENIRQQFLLLQ